MLRPSYSDLLEVLNKDQENDNLIRSRYTIVIAASKRARQLVDHAPTRVTEVHRDKPVSVAVTELFEGKMKIKNFEKEQREEFESDSDIQE